MMMKYDICFNLICHMSPVVDGHPEGGAALSFNLFVSFCIVLHRFEFLFLTIKRHVSHPSRGHGRLGREATIYIAVT
jgi:hypothetical protein